MIFFLLRKLQENKAATYTGPALEIHATMPK